MKIVSLLPLPILFGGEKTASLFLTLADESCTTSKALADILKNEVPYGDEQAQDLAAACFTFALKKSLR